MGTCAAPWAGGAGAVGRAISTRLWGCRSKAALIRLLRKRERLYEGTRGSRGPGESLRGPREAVPGFLSPINPRINRFLSQRRFPGSIREHLNTINRLGPACSPGLNPANERGNRVRATCAGNRSRSPGRNRLYGRKGAEEPPKRVLLPLRRFLHRSMSRFHFFAFKNHIYYFFCCLLLLLLFFSFLFYHSRYF